MDYISSKPEDILSDLNSSYQGLNSQNIKQRIEAYGKNELDKRKRISNIAIFTQQFKSISLCILLFITIVSFLIGNYQSSIAIISITLLHILFGFIQDTKATQTITKQKNKRVKTANVIRDAQKQRIDASELVPGDILLIGTGDIVPADARLFEAIDLEVDESELTGSIDAAKKDTSPAIPGSPIDKQSGMVFSDTIVLKGKGRAIVVKTGIHTTKRTTHLKKTINSKQKGHTPQKEKQENIMKRGITIIYLMLIPCIAMILLSSIISPHYLEAITNFNFMNLNDWLRLFLHFNEAILIIVALAFACSKRNMTGAVNAVKRISLGKISTDKIFIQKNTSLERLSKVNVICTDKSGILTKKEMTVRKISFNGKQFEITGNAKDTQGEFLKEGIQINPEGLSMILKIGALNNDAQLNPTQPFGRPQELALLISAAKAGLHKSDLEERYPRVEEIPFDKERNIKSTLHKDNDNYLLFSKGDPFSILQRCTNVLLDKKIVALTPEIRAKIFSENTTYASKGLYVIGFAFKRTESKQISEDELIFIGMQAIEYSLSDTIKDEISKCDDEGIRPVIITSDQIATAKAIAQDIGISGRSMIGKEIDSKENLSDEIEDVSLFAQINPKQKKKILAALKKRGDVVALIGEDKHDKNASEHADVTIAKADTSCDVIKERADIIMTHNSLSKILDTISQSRSAKINIKKAAYYSVSSNITLILFLFMASVASLLYLPSNQSAFALMASQILWISLIINRMPSFGLAFDPLRTKIIQDYNIKKQTITQQIISKKDIIFISAEGIMMGWTITYLFMLAHLFGTATKAQTIAFTALLAFEIIRIFILRNHYKTAFFSNRFIWSIVGITILSYVLFVYLKQLNPFFGTIPLLETDLIPVGVAGLAILIIGSIISRSIR